MTKAFLQGSHKSYVRSHGRQFFKLYYQAYFVTVVEIRSQDGTFNPDFSAVEFFGDIPDVFATPLQVLEVGDGHKVSSPL